MASAEPVEDPTPMRAMLEDQDGRPERFEEFFRGKPSIVAFFYTRCDNPYKCSLTITKLAALQASLEERGLAGALKVTAITYDPEFDLPHRLRLYGSDRGVQFGKDARFFRITSGFQEIRQRFHLGVNYGASTVNRHQTEVYLLNEHGEISASFTRMRWEVVASELRCKRATGVGSLEELTTHEGDLHPWHHEYRPPRPSAPRSTSCSRPTASC
jgi:protein SCO1/2